MIDRLFTSFAGKSVSGKRPSTTLIVVALSTVVLVTPALASLKSLMEQMGAANKVAKSLSGNGFDSAKAIGILQTFADQSDQSIKATPANADGKDMNKRFAVFSTTARAAAVPGLDKAKYTAAYADIVSQCKSCHTSYRN